MSCSTVEAVIANNKMKAFPRPAGGGDANDIVRHQDNVENRSFSGELVASPQTLAQDVGDHDLASPDWLEVTHAMLDEGNECDQAGSR